MAVRRERDFAEAAAFHMRDAVVLGEPFVEERVVGAQQVERAPVLADDALEEELGFRTERLPQRVVEVRKVLLHGNRRVEVAQEQPLSSERLDERREARVRNHSMDLPVEYRRIVQLVALGQRQKILVRNAVTETKP